MTAAARVPVGAAAVGSGAGTVTTTVAVVGAGLVFLVGFARVILNVHHPSDVVAGWALGYLYYLLCVRLVPPRPLTSAVETPAELDTVP